MVDAAVAADIDVRELAVEAGAAAHIGVVALRQVEPAGHVLRRHVGTGPVEGNDQRHRYAVPVERLRHRHDRIGAERMPDQDDRPAIAGAVLCRDLRHDRVGLGMVVDTRGNAALCDLRCQLVHAEREDVHEPAQQIDVGPGRRFVLLRRARLGGGQREHQGRQAGEGERGCKPPLSAGRRRRQVVRCL